jgi:hypothetical protein
VSNINSSQWFPLLLKVYDDHGMAIPPQHLSSTHKHTDIEHHVGGGGVKLFQGTCMYRLN